MAEVTTYQTLSGMLAPALFMTATGSLLLTANNRLARVVDRLRVLFDQLDRLSQRAVAIDFIEEREDKVRQDMARMKMRGSLIFLAITRLYLAFACFVGSSLMLAVDSWTQYSVSAVPTALAVVGVTLLLSACLHLFYEARGGVAVLEAEVAFVEKLREKRQRAANSTPTARNGA